MNERDPLHNDCSKPERSEDWYLERGYLGGEAPAITSPSKTLQRESVDSPLSTEADQALVQRDELLQHLLRIKQGKKSNPLVCKHLFHDALLESNAEDDEELCKIDAEVDERHGSEIAQQHEVRTATAHEDEAKVDNNCVADSSFLAQPHTPVVALKSAPSMAENETAPLVNNGSSDNTTESKGRYVLPDHKRSGKKRKAAETESCGDRNVSAYACKTTSVSSIPRCEKKFSTPISTATAIGVPVAQKQKFAESPGHCRWRGTTDNYVASERTRNESFHADEGHHSARSLEQASPAAKGLAAPVTEKNKVPTSATSFLLSPSKVKTATPKIKESAGSAKKNAVPVIVGASIPTLQCSSRSGTRTSSKVSRGRHADQDGGAESGQRPPSRSLDNNKKRLRQISFNENRMASKKSKSRDDGSPTRALRGSPRNRNKICTISLNSNSPFARLSARSPESDAANKSSTKSSAASLPNARRPAMRHGRDGKARAGLSPRRNFLREPSRKSRGLSDGESRRSTKKLRRSRSESTSPIQNVVPVSKSDEVIDLCDSD